MTADERNSYEHVIRVGEQALARWSPTNPARGWVERNVADARAKLAGVR